MTIIVHLELSIMKILLKTIKHEFPNVRVLPLIIINNVELNTDINQCMKILHKRGLVRRPVCQYGALAQVSIDYGNPIELAVENEQGSMMRRAVLNKLTNNFKNRQITEEYYEQEPELQIFRNLRFPIIHLSKQNMLDHAKKRKYAHILKNTWSCWYPNKGKPCGRCIMCRERII